MSFNKGKIKVESTAKGIKNPYSKDVLYSPEGQWKYPGQITKIPSGDITMQGVDYPVHGIDNLGNSQMMYPGMHYQFPGDSVTEYPQFQGGGSIQSYIQLPNLDNSSRSERNKLEEKLFKVIAPDYYPNLKVIEEQTPSTYSVQTNAGSPGIGYNPQNSNLPSEDSNNWLSNIYYQINRGLVKYGLKDAHDLVDTIKNNTVDLKTKQDSISKPTADSLKPDTEVKPFYKQLGKTKDGFVSYINLFDNNKGFNYVPTEPISVNKTYPNVNHMAHFLYDYDVVKDKPVNDSETQWFHQRDKASTWKADNPGSTVTDPYFTQYSKLPDGKVNIKYIKKSELEDLENQKKPLPKLADSLRQYRYTDINWNSEGPAKGFNSSIKTLYTKDNKQTYFISPKGTKDAYGKFGGNSVVFLIDGKNVAIDFAGSVNQIKSQADKIIQDYKIDPKDLIIAYHDVGSYSAKPSADKNHVLSSSQYDMFNTNRQTGAGLAIPSDTPQFQQGGVPNPAYFATWKPRIWEAVNTYQTGGLLKPNGEPYNPLKAAFVQSQLPPEEKYVPRFTPQLNNVDFETAKQNDKRDKYVPSNRNIKLHHGNFNTGSVNTAELDSSMVASHRQGLDSPWNPIGTIGTESTFKEDPYIGRGIPYPYDPHSLTTSISNWDYALKLHPEYIRYYGEKNHDEIDHEKLDQGWMYWTNNPNSLDKTFTQKDVENYKKHIINQQRNLPGNAYDNLALRWKNGEMDHYNPKDPNYLKTVANNIEDLKKDKELRDYVENYWNKLNGVNNTASQVDYEKHGGTHFNKSHKPFDYSERSRINEVTMARGGSNINLMKNTFSRAWGGSNAANRANHLDSIPSMMAKEGGSGFQSEDNDIFTDKKNNFLELIHNMSMDALHKELVPHAIFHHMPDGSIVSHGEMQEQQGEGMKKGGIHIKKSHEGRFTAYKKRTGKTTEEALHSKDPHVRQMANFARNAAKWKHEEGGNVGGDQYMYEPGGYMQQGGFYNPDMAYAMGGDISIPDLTPDSFYSKMAYGGERRWENTGLMDWRQDGGGMLATAPGQTNDFGYQGVNNNFNLAAQQARNNANVGKSFNTFFEETVNRNMNKRVGYDASVQNPKGKYGMINTFQGGGSNDIPTYDQYVQQQNTHPYQYGNPQYQPQQPIQTGRTPGHFYQTRNAQQGQYPTNINVQPNHWQNSSSSWFPMNTMIPTNHMESPYHPFHRGQTEHLQALDPNQYLASTDMKYGWLDKSSPKQITMNFRKPAGFGSVTPYQEPVNYSKKADYNLPTNNPVNKPLSEEQDTFANYQPPAQVGAPFENTSSKKRGGSLKRADVGSVITPNNAVSIPGAGSNWGVNSFVQDPIQRPTSSNDPQQITMDGWQTQNQPRVAPRGFNENYTQPGQTVTFNRHTHYNPEDTVNWGLAGMEALTSMANIPDMLHAQQQAQNRTHADMAFTAIPPNAGSRGDYDIKSGRFRENQQTPAQFQSMARFGGSFAMGGFQEGGEYYLDENEIERILAEGGTVEYLD